MGRTPALLLSMLPGIAPLLAGGCDNVFMLEPVKLPIDAPPDSPPDAPIDAPTILMCDTSPLIVWPTELQEQGWAQQVPPESDRVDVIADLAGADDDASYIATAFDGQLDMYKHIPLHSSVQVVAVTIWARARIDSATPISEHQVGPAFRIDDVPPVFEYDDAVVSETWGNVSSQRYNTFPNTVNAWTADDVNRLVFGVRKSYTKRVLVTKIWASVECTPP